MKKKRDTGFWEQIGPVRLFRDDLERIIETLREAKLEVRVSDASDLFESIDDVIAGRGERPRELSIEADQAYPQYGEIRLWIQRTHVGLSCAGVPEIVRLGYQVKSMVQALVPRRSIVLRPFVFFVAFIIVLDLLPPVLRNPVAAPRLLILVSILFIAWVVALADRLLSYGLFLRRRHVGGFFRRNRDQLLLLIIGCILGVAGTLVAQWFAK